MEGDEDLHDNDASGLGAAERRRIGNNRLGIWPELVQGPGPGGTAAGTTTSRNVGRHHDLAARRQSTGKLLRS